MSYCPGSNRASLCADDSDIASGECVVGDAGDTFGNAHILQSRTVSKRPALDRQRAIGDNDRLRCGADKGLAFNYRYSVGQIQHIGQLFDRVGHLVAPFSIHKIRVAGIDLQIERGILGVIVADIGQIMAAAERGALDQL